MREVLKTFVPRTHWAATNVNLVPTVAHGAQLARWGGVGVFGAFWMIGTNRDLMRDLCCFVSCDLFFVVVFEFFSLERRRCIMQTIFFFSRFARSRLCRALLPLAMLLLTGDNAFAWAKSFVVDPPTDEN